MSFHYYMFHKPAGCITALKDEKEKTIVDYLTKLDMSTLRAVGRLDKDTEGLLFLTDDGQWLQHMTRPEAGIEKEYYFWAMGSMDHTKLTRLGQGICLNGMTNRVTRPASLRVIETATLQDIHPLIQGKNREHILKNRPEHPVFSGCITVTEGRKHEVRRLLKSIGCCCIYLKRIRMGIYELDPTLAAGEYKEFTPSSL